MSTDKTRDGSSKTASPENDGAEAPVLVVDLDGTLSRSDTLHEALLMMLASRPITVLKLPGWLRQGRAKFKAHIADDWCVPAGKLPLNEEVLERVRAARTSGRRTALVSAADQRQVQLVAEEIGLFDDVFGSDPDRNLKGGLKANFLVERYGKDGFDYMGDAPADMDVWSAARKVITVEASPRLQKRVDTAFSDVTHIGQRNEVSALLRAMRPHQWLKNLLVFAPMAAAHDFSALGASLLAFIAFCMVASSAYFTNDLLDLAADRAHPRKRKRPFASGDLSLSVGVGGSVALVLAAIVFSAFTGQPAFLGVLACYLAVTILYSVWLKRKPILDVFVLAGLYTIRIVGGGAATGIVLSPWMLGFSMFLFLSLAAVKRQTEMMDAAVESGPIPGRGYTVDDLPILRSIAISAANGAVVVFALYINSLDIQELYARPQLLWAVCPLLLYWLYRMVMKAHRKEMTDDPIVFAATDKASLAIIMTSAALVVFAAA